MRYTKNTSPNSSPKNSAKQASKRSIDSLNQMLLSGLISKGEREPLLAKDPGPSVSPDTSFKFKSN